MKIGTKSLLYGAHQFLIHPICVWIAWVRLYGPTYDPKIILSFFLHDIGYWGCPNMDGREGKQHPHRGAEWMGAMFGLKWHQFTLLHSRSVAAYWEMYPSQLCYADKLATFVLPRRLYLFLVELTGEIDEYIEDCLPEMFPYYQKHTSEGLHCAWYDWMKKYQLRNIAKRKYRTIYIVGT